MCFYTIRLNEQYSKDTIGLNRGRNLEFSFLVGIFFVNASQAEPGRYPRSRLGFFFLFCARVERGCLSSRQPRKTARSPVLLLVLAVFFLVWIRGGKLVRIGLPGFLVSNTATDDSPLPRKKIPFEHQIEHEVKAHGQKGEVVPGAQQDGKSQGGQGQQARRGQSCGHPRRRGGLHPGAQQAVKGHAAVQGLDGQAVEDAQHQVGPGKIAFPLAQKRQGPGQEPIYPGASQGDRRHLPVGEELLPVGNDAAAQGRHLDRGRGRFQPKEHCHVGGLVAGGGCQKKGAAVRPQEQAAKGQQRETGESQAHLAASQRESHHQIRWRDASPSQGLGLGVGWAEGEGPAVGPWGSASSQAGSWISWEASCWYQAVKVS